MNNDCPHCLDHENRIRSLEKDMDEIKADNKKQKVLDNRMTKKDFETWLKGLTILKGEDTYE